MSCVTYSYFRARQPFHFLTRFILKFEVVADSPTVQRTTLGRGQTVFVLRQNQQNLFTNIYIVSDLFSIVHLPDSAERPAESKIIIQLFAEMDQDNVFQANDN